MIARKIHVPFDTTKLNRTQDVLQIGGNKSYITLNMNRKGEMQQVLKWFHIYFDSKRVGYTS